MSKEGSTDSWYMYRADQFEQNVAAIYTALGASVERQVVIAGTRIDMIITEHMTTDQCLRAAIECKIYNDPIPHQALEPFTGIVSLLRERGLIEKAIIIGSPAFSKAATEKAQANNIDLILIEDLENKVKGKKLDFRQKQEHLHIKTIIVENKRSEIFVVMPFERSFEDVYILGIREVAETMGHVVERADSIEHNRDILSFIQEKIRSCNCVIADITNQNPNVYYEVGYAHACNIPVILITRSGSEIPIDLRNMNHIFYENIVDLREKLEKRIISTIQKVSIKEV